MSDNRPFPIQEDIRTATTPTRPASSIPWWLADVAYKAYTERYGSGQSLERLAERGGFGRDELLMLLRPR